MNDGVEDGFRFRSIFTQKICDFLDHAQVLVDNFLGSSNDLFFLNRWSGDVGKDPTYYGVWFYGEYRSVQDTVSDTDIFLDYIVCILQYMGKETVKGNDLFQRCSFHARVGIKNSLNICSEESGKVFIHFDDFEVFIDYDYS